MGMPKRNAVSNSSAVIREAARCMVRLSPPMRVSESEPRGNLEKHDGHSLRPELHNPAALAEINLKLCPTHKS